MSISSRGRSSLDADGQVDDPDQINERILDEAIFRARANAKQLTGPMQNDAHKKIEHIPFQIKELMHRTVSQEIVPNLQQMAGNVLDAIAESTEEVECETTEHQALQAVAEKVRSLGKFLKSPRYSSPHKNSKISDMFHTPHPRNPFQLHRNPPYFKYLDTRR